MKLREYESEMGVLRYGVREGEPWKSSDTEGVQLECYQGARHIGFTLMNWMLWW